MDPLIIGGNHYTVDHARAFETRSYDMLDHRFAGNLHERFAGETGSMHSDAGINARQTVLKISSLRRFGISAVCRRIPMKKSLRFFLGAFGTLRCQRRASDPALIVAKDFVTSRHARHRLDSLGIDLVELLDIRDDLVELGGESRHLLGIENRSRARRATCSICSMDIVECISYEYYCVAAILGKLFGKKLFGNVCHDRQMRWTNSF